MTAAQLRSSMRVLILAVVVVAPLIFWRGVADGFELTKATAVGVLGLLLLAALALYVALGERRSVPREAQVLTAMLFVALTAVTATSISPITSLVGQIFRYTGLYTLLCCLALYVAASVAFDRRQIERFAWVCTLVALPVVYYALLQVTDNDPFAWGASGFQIYHMSTLSNPNISAAFTAILLPLIAYTMLRNDAPRWVSVTAGAIFGGAVACLSVFYSFQGPAAALATVAVLVAWTVWRRESLGGWIVTLALVAMVGVVPAMAPSGTLVIGSAVASATLLLMRPRLVALRSPSSWVRRRRVLGFAATTVGLLLVMFQWRLVVDYIHRGLENGLHERGDMYRTAWSIFRQYPLLGSGLETYGVLFPTARPVSHAVNRESWLSSSAHSVPLGMFSNGGVVLGLAYLLFVGMTALVLFRCLRATPAAERGLAGAVGAAWLAFQVQSLVSTENVTLFAFHFILSGLIMALAAQRGVLRSSKVVVAADGLDRVEGLEAGSPTSSGGRAVPAAVMLAEVDTVAETELVDAPAAAEPRRISKVIVAGALLMCCLIAVTVTARPLRAARASQNGSNAVINHGDLSTALREFSRSVELAPWEGQARLRMADLYRLTGERERALAETAIAADDARGNPDIYEWAAGVAGAAGDDAAALGYMERSLAAVPHGAKTRARVADAYMKAGVRAAQAGEVDVARNRFLRALELEPGLTAAQQALAEL
jgi:Tfp pilus assembly protein PilF